MNQPTVSSSLVECIPNIITNEDNLSLCRIPDEQEIRDVFLI